MIYIFLKSRRFLRKPNVTEACESFTSLGQHCEDVEMPVYAGLCWIAAARCEGSLGNLPGESNCLIRSARQFLTAELKDHQLGCISPSNENLQVSQCFEVNSCVLRKNIFMITLKKKFYATVNKKHV